MPATLLPTAALPELFRRRLLFVTGKGGVGKSLISAGAALHNARAGRRTLWVEMSETPKGAYLFEGYTPAYEPQRIERNLWGMNLRFQPAIEEYLEIVFKIPFLSKTIARNSLFRAFTTALPGLDALVTTGKIWFEAERAVSGKPYWDHIVVDAPATGHGLALLKFPHAALDIVRSGPVAERARDIDRMLGNRDTTGIVVVSLLEELPTDEAAELVAGIHRDTGYRVAALVANARFPDIGGHEAKRFTAWLAGSKDQGLDTTLGGAAEHVRARLRWLEHWRNEQTIQLEKLLAVGPDVYEVPWLPALNERQTIADFYALTRPSEANP